MSDHSLPNIAYAPENFNVHGLQELFYPVSEKEERDGVAQKVSGGEENSVEGHDDDNNNSNNKGSLLEKFRFLLGLRKSFNMKKHSSSEFEYASPSPSPSPSGEEAEPPGREFSPSPAPAKHIPAHPHNGRHGLHSLHPPHKIRNDGQKDRVRRVLIAVLVSIGAATLICVVGLIWAWKKYKKHQKKSKRRVSVYGKTRGRSKSTKPKASKVSLNPGLDLLYLDSLGKDLEQQPQAQPSSCMKKSCETLDKSSSNVTLPDRRAEFARESEPKLEFDNVSSSSTREITSVHEDGGDSVNNEYDCLTSPSPSGDKIVPIESRFSDDESFHSFAESNSSNAVRLSNASLGSFSDALENFNSNEQNKSSCLLPPSAELAIKPSIHSKNSSLAPDLRSQSNEEQVELLSTAGSSIPPPPPPPPLPPPRVNFLPSRSLSRSSRVESKASSSSTIPNVSSPKESNSLSISNKTLQANDSKPSTSPPGIPPPPCPPPFFKPNNSSLKTPPPPPSQLPQFSPLGKDGSALPKLKPLHWDKVRATPDHSMVWDKLRSSSFELDEEMIESLFGYNLQNSMKNDESKSKTPSPSKHVLEPKRLQNITILSKALNVSADQVCEALLQGSGLSLQQLEALVKMVPTKEEEAKLSGYGGDINELGSAEKFVRAMLSIPFAFQRAEAMLYRETFEDEVVHLRNSFSMLEEACKELRSSRLFLKLLEAVLKTGNRMNVGTIRGGARAFKLDALLKLADVKGTDGKTTLLHFVVQEIIRSEGIRVADSIMGRINQKNKTRTPEEKEEDYRRMGLDLVSGLSTELYNVKKTAAIDLDVIVSSVSNLSEEMATIRGLITKELSMEEESISFVNSMNCFVSYGERKLKELRGEEDKVMSQVKEITEYFHGDVSKEEANPLRIFVIVRDFLGMLDLVCKELRSSKAPRSPNPLAPFR
ncbi:hypothetical protein TIFTF001_013100 [Ficus carica]|uniref:Formin-like protein n=1 Tax=Ficus carica TaxID=3494 RepID=A0AA88D4A4_FICCA|nr:hypothetical protein TIFTF001_013100 [Ficus carica]